MFYSRFQLTFRRKIPIELGCEVPKFVAKFKSSFQNSQAGFFDKLLNFETILRTSRQSSESYSENLAAIDCNSQSGVKFL